MREVLTLERPITLFVSVVLSFSAMLVWPQAASACSCVGRQLPITSQQYREWVAAFDGAVFRGTVLSVERVKGSYLPGVTNVTLQPGWKVTLLVDRHWKSVTSPQMVIYTGEDEGVCGIRFQVRGVYLVAAARQEGGLTANVCSVGWFHTRDPEAFRSALGEGSPAPAP